MVCGGLGLMFGVFCFDVLMFGLGLFLVGLVVMFEFGCGCGLVLVWLFVDWLLTVG